MTGIIDAGFPLRVSYGEMSFLRRILTEERMRLWQGATKGSGQLKKMCRHEIDDAFRKMFAVTDEVRMVGPLSDDQRVGLLLEKCDAIEQECQAALKGDSQ